VSRDGRDHRDVLRPRPGGVARVAAGAPRRQAVHLADTPEEECARAAPVAAGGDRGGRLLRLGRQSAQAHRRPTACAALLAPPSGRRVGGVEQGARRQAHGRGPHDARRPGRDRSRQGQRRLGLTAHQRAARRGAGRSAGGARRRRRGRRSVRRAGAFDAPPVRPLGHVGQAAGDAGAPRCGDGATRSPRPPRERAVLARAPAATPGFPTSRSAASSSPSPACCRRGRWRTRTTCRYPS